MLWFYSPFLDYKISVTAEAASVYLAFLGFSKKLFSWLSPHQWTHFVKAKTC